MQEQSEQNLEYIDEELRKQLWNQVARVEFIMNPLDIALDQENPIPLYLKVNRAKYPSFYYQKIDQFFQRYAPCPLNAKNIWLEYNGVPVQSNIPFGVSLDLIKEVGQFKIQINIQCNPEKEYITLIVNYRRKPKEKIITFYEDLQTELIHQYHWTLKQATLIRYKQKGLNQFFQILNREQLENLYRSYSDINQEKSLENCDQFYKLFDQLYSITPLKKENQLQIPVRLYISQFQGRIQDGFILSDINQTIGSQLQKIFPQLISKSDVNEYIFNQNENKKIEMLIHGIPIDLNQPARTLLFDLYHPDGFVYIVLRVS